MSIVDVWFTLLALATVVGYGFLVWLGMSPERALGFVFGGGIVIGLLSRAAIGVLTPEGESHELIEPAERTAEAASTPGRADTSRGARK